MATPAKVPKADGDVSNDMEQIQKVDKIQSNLDELNEKASEEILQVEQKYNKLRQPLYSQRNDDIADIPRFWLTCFINHPQISALISEEDEAALAHMYKLEVEEFEDIKSGYKIHMHFNKNEYFSNTMLTKEFRLTDQGEPTFTGTKIEWYPTKNIIANCQQASANNGNAKGKRPADSGMDSSFFFWFSDEEATLSAELGEIIKDDVWPSPLQYFLNAEGEDNEDGDEEDDEEGSDEEDEESEGAE
jgi:template-activating factor I